MEVITKIGDFLLVEYKPQASTWMFNAFYMASVCVFATATVVSTAGQYIGDPINCISTGFEHDERKDQFCYFLFTYTINHPDFMKLDSKKHVYPGVGNDIQGDKRYDRTYQHFYLWVPLLLLAQTVSFYIPRFLWNCWDSSVLELLLEGLWKRKTIALIKEQKNKLEEVHSFFVSNLHSHNSWAMRFYSCELLTLLIAALNFIFIDLYLGGEFISLGWSSLSYALNRDNVIASPLERVFPKMAMCEYRKYAPSGQQNKEHMLCIMAVNNVNQKIYVFLCFFLKLMMAFCAVSLVLRLSVLYSRSARFLKLGRPGVQVSDKTMEMLDKHLHHGDWLMLLSIGENLDHVTFGYLLAKINETMETWSPENDDIEMPVRPRRVSEANFDPRSNLYPSLPRGNNVSIVDGVPTKQPPVPARTDATLHPPPYNSIDTLPVQPKGYKNGGMSDSEGFMSSDDLLR